MRLYLFVSAVHVDKENLWCPMPSYVLSASLVSMSCCNSLCHWVMYGRGGAFPYKVPEGIFLVSILCVTTYLFNCILLVTGLAHFLGRLCMFMAVGGRTSVGSGACIKVCALVCSSSLWVLIVLVICTAVSLSCVCWWSFVRAFSLLQSAQCYLW